MRTDRHIRKPKKIHTGLWIILIAAAALEAISCLQYFYSRAGIRAEAEQQAQSELRRAELEIEVVTSRLEAAVQVLASMAERDLKHPQTMYDATRDLLGTLDFVESAGIAFVPEYYKEYGRWFEVCSSRTWDEDGTGEIYTRQIGGADHDYLQTEWFHNGLTIDSCWWCEPYLDDAGAKTMVVSCSYPVRDSSGKVVAVALVDLSLNQLRHISEYLQIYKDSYYSIRSGKGLDIVAGADTVPGRKYQIYDEEIDATGWKISIIIPEDVIFADLNRIGKIVGLLMLLGLAMLILIVWYAGRSNKKLLDSTAKNQRMENELHIARAIQMAMLPKVFPPFVDRPDINVYGIVNPAKEVGGDLYDFYVRQDKLFFCVGDVSGKGVPAALVMAMSRSLFRSITAHEESAAGVVRQMNDTMAEQNDQDMFITLFLGVLDMETGMLDYCNAGHNAPVHMRFDGSRLVAESLPVDANLPLGILCGYEYKSQSTKLEYGDMLFLYTDGLNEAENNRHEQYGEERMMRTLSAFTDNRPRNIVDTMQESVDTFTDGAEQSDDLTMLAIRYQTPAIVMRNDIQQIPTLAEWIEGLGIPEELSMPVNLALEEIVSNVMLYAYPDKSGKVFVEFTRLPSSIIFTVSDSGIPFDPTAQAPADITLSAEERTIGGLGIHLVRQLMDEITYRREEDKNILVLVKNL